MKISEILRESKKCFPSIEVVPPLTGISKEALLDSVRPFMDFAPKYINVTCHRNEYVYTRNPDGSFTRHLEHNRVSEVAVCCAIQSRYNIEVVPHIICGGVDADAIRGKLHNLSFMGIHNVMALRGDCISGEKRFTPVPGGYAHANELVEGIRQFEKAYGGDFCIGVGAYPEKHSEAANIETDIENLKRKVDAGADYIITQMFYDNSKFYDFEARCRKACITVPIIPGIKPLSTRRHLALLPEAFSLDVPIELSRAVIEAGDDKEAIFRIGTDWSKNQCRDLIAHGVKAIHFYTMGKASNVTEILRDCF